MVWAAFPEFRVQHSGQLVGDQFIFGIDQLGDEDPGEESGEVVKLYSEMTEFRIRHITGSKPVEIRVVNRTVAKNDVSHLMVEPRHGLVPPCG